MSRFLFAYPYSKDTSYNESPLSEESRKQVAKLFETLKQLVSTKRGRTKDVVFSADGRREWLRWIKKHQKEFNSMPEEHPCRAAWRKLEAYTARLILVLHVVRRASGELKSLQVTRGTVRMASRLAEYFKAHAVRAYGQARTGSPPTFLSLEERAESWIKKKGNPGVTRRDLIGARIAHTTKEASSVLDKLAADGLGTWKQSTGQRVHRFYLASQHSALSTKGTSEVPLTPRQRREKRQ